MRWFSTVFAVAFLLTACAQPDDPQPGPVPADGAQRIVSLAPNLTEIVFAAGAGDRLVGVVEYSDYPAAALDIPRVGDAFRVDFEVLKSLEPDLILAWESGNPAEIVQRLKELGYRVVLLEASDLDSIGEQLRQVGELAGTGVAAAAAADDYKDRIAALRAREPTTPLSVFWQISANPYFTITGQHVINEIISLCGGRNVFAALPGLAPAVTLESIIAERPQVIVASVASGDDVWKEAWQRWEQLPAVSNGNLYSVDPDLVSRSGPRIADGAAAVCAALDAARD